MSQRWTPLCGDCWALAAPDEYFPEASGSDECGVCGAFALIVNVHPEVAALARRAVRLEAVRLALVEQVRLDDARRALPPGPDRDAAQRRLDRHMRETRQLRILAGLCVVTDGLCLTHRVVADLGHDLDANGPTWPDGTARND